MTDAGPRVAGVTGHRTDGLHDVDERLLRRRVDGVLHVLTARGYGELVSGLAEGADRLVARRALRCDWTLRALLPFLPKRYEEDFPAADSRGAFRRLLARSTSVEIAPGGDGGDDPDRPYAVQGRLLVDRVTLLLAVWDGRPARGPGGTGDVVELALESGRPVVWIHARAPHRVRFADMQAVQGPLASPLEDSLGALLDGHRGRGKT